MTLASRVLIILLLHVSFFAAGKKIVKVVPSPGALYGTGDIIFFIAFQFLFPH